MSATYLLCSLLSKATDAECHSPANFFCLCFSNAVNWECGHSSLCVSIGQYSSLANIPRAWSTRHTHGGTGCEHAVICMQYMGLVQDQSLTCIHYRQTCTLYVGGNELHTGIRTYTQECTRNACSNLQCTCMFSAYNVHVHVHQMVNHILTYM